MLIFGLLVPIAFGFIISSVIIPRTTIYERLGVGYGLGFGFLTLGMFFLNVFGLKFSLVNTLILISGIIAILLIYLYLKRENPFAYSSFGKLNLFSRPQGTYAILFILEWIMIGFLALLIVSRIFSGLWSIVWRWDALAVYDFRARIFADTLFLPEAVLKVQFPWFIFQYPPMTSLVHAWLYSWGWATPMIFYPLLLASLAAIFYSSLRDYSPRYHCLLFTLILVTAGDIYSEAVSSFLNFPFAFYFGVGSIYLYRWISTQKKGFLILAGVFLGLSAWVRRESPIFFLGYLLILLIFSIRRRQFFAPLLFAFLYFSIQPLWRIYFFNVILAPQPVSMISQSTGMVSQVSMVSQSTGMVSHSLGVMRQFFGIIFQAVDVLKKPGIFFDSPHWREVLIYLKGHILTPYRGLFLLLILSTLLCIDKLRNHFFLLLLVLSNIVLFLIATYVFSLQEPTWKQIGGSATRLFMMFLPIMWYYIALITTEHNFLPKFLNLRAASVRADSNIPPQDARGRIG